MFKVLRIKVSKINVTVIVEMNMTKATQDPIESSTSWEELAGGSKIHQDSVSPCLPCRRRQEQSSGILGMTGILVPSAFESHHNNRPCRSLPGPPSSVHWVPVHLLERWDRLLDPAVRNSQAETAELLEQRLELWQKDPCCYRTRMDSSIPVAAVSSDMAVRSNPAAGTHSVGREQHG